MLVVLVEGLVFLASDLFAELLVSFPRRLQAELFRRLRIDGKQGNQLLELLAPAGRTPWRIGSGKNKEFELMSAFATLIFENRHLIHSLLNVFQPHPGGIRHHNYETPFSRVVGQFEKLNT